MSDQNFRKSNTGAFTPTTASSKKNSKLGEIPIFNLLKAFKLQQYTRQLESLGYGTDVYKIALLLPKQRHELLKSLSLMPGHKAKFLSLFEVIDQIYPKSEKLKLISDTGKGGSKGAILNSIIEQRKVHTAATSNQSKHILNNRNTSKSANKRRNKPSKGIIIKYLERNLFIN